MFSQLFRLFAGRHYRKFCKQCQPRIQAIQRFEEQYQSLTDEELAAKTQEFMERHRKGESLDRLLPEAFAAVKNAARRLYGKPIVVCEHESNWDMIHYDVQLLGGIALHESKIAEMATGEGKTLVATLPLYLNSLTGKNCQLATVNDYLARRDSEWMGYLFKSLGLTVGCIQNGMNSLERQQAYACSITYGTSSEFGFDYLRDNGMTHRAEDQVQRDHYFCIVDEIDSILIDEARTPLIISGLAEEQKEAPFRELKPMVEHLVAQQTRLCNQLVEEAKNRLEANAQDEEAYALLWKVKHGMPKNRQFLRLLENGAYRKQFDKFDLELGSEVNREKRFEMKETLFFSIDEHNNQSDLSEKGRQTLYPQDPNAFVIPDLPAIFSDIEGNSSLDRESRQEQKQVAEREFVVKSERIHCLQQLLRAYSLFNRDENYVVQDGKVVIVDENTGRALPGRRWNEGLHQAVEAKENLTIEGESKTYATITIQNYFRMYEKLAGMTGTAETEAQEFFDIYKLSVMAIPTHRPCIREDRNDTIYKTRRGKYHAIIEEVKEAHGRGQPILLGTASVETSELLSRMLKHERIPHTVLNAKFHEQEANIVAAAGQKGAVTIATNMAGRGTDIRLGEGVAACGGLMVIGSERHESRRVDRQLRGRCARQGDPGVSKFFVSLEDDLMRLFAGNGPIANILDRSFKEGEVLEHPLLNRSIESAQKKIEAFNYSQRRRLLQYDDVLNRQRSIIYELRNRVLRETSSRELVFEFIEEELRRQLEGIGEEREEQALENFLYWVNVHFPIGLKRETLETLPDNRAIEHHILEAIREAYRIKAEMELSPEALPLLEQHVLLQSIDHHWQNHLTEMEELRRSVMLRGYGQKDPLNEYKNEAYHFFENLLGQIRQEVCKRIFRTATRVDYLQGMLDRLARRPLASVSDARRLAFPEERAHGNGIETREEKGLARLPQEGIVVQRALESVAQVRSLHDRSVRRNEVCPCGSGKKYKKCCGRHG
ncbi:MAG: preprotein translocase subunit SecA [Puniceicoccales bacterium]|jgi:preprotein translocase subunit SecA|nr:preprotein translocase subunit SecA [Puniceicoccales bacterium]